MPHRCSAAVACSAAALLGGGRGRVVGLCRERVAEGHARDPQPDRAARRPRCRRHRRRAGATASRPSRSTPTAIACRRSAGSSLTAPRHAPPGADADQRWHRAAAPVRDPEARGAHDRPARRRGPRRCATAARWRSTPSAAPRPRPRQRPPAPGTQAAPPAPTPEQPKADPALFRVGTSVVDISPDKPMDVGGYGSGYQRDRRRPRPASGARVLRRPRQAGRDVRVGRRAGLVRRLPGAERRRRGRRRAPRGGRGAQPTAATT